jgi:hypothetical protein
MRATSTALVFSSLFLAASVAAGPNDKTNTSDKSDKKAPAQTSGSAAAKSPTSSGAAKSPTGSGAAKSPTGSGAASGSAAPANSGNAAPASGGDTAPAGGPAPVAPSTDVATVRPEDMPTAVRMRRLEQKTQALKERAWQLKARVQMLKEQMLGGGVGAQTVISHANEMGASFRLIKLIYSLDGTQVFARTDETAESLYKTKAFDVFAGPISPGNHTVLAIATYRGHGYGVFEYLSKFTFTAKGNQAFIAGEGKIAKVDCKGFEKGGPTTPLEKRAAVECKVTQVQPEKPADKSGATPGDTGPSRPGDTTPSKPSATPAPGPSSPPASTSTPGTKPASPSATPASPSPAPASTPAPKTTQPATQPGK